MAHLLFHWLNFCFNVHIPYTRFCTLFINLRSLKLPHTKTPNEKQQIESRLASTDKKIGELVYELYGLSGEEIKIIETC